MITRGTTPYYTFIAPLAPEQIKKIYVTFAQNKKVIFNKTEKDIEITPVEINIKSDVEVPEDKRNETVYSQIAIHLTQSDTLKFQYYPAAEKNLVGIQLRILDVDDEAYASKIQHERLGDVLKDGVLKDRGQANV